MICPTCARAADMLPGLEHPAELCRDQAIHPHGCTCQHGAPRGGDRD